MLKDITPLQDENVGVAIVKELNMEMEIEWNVFVVNYTEHKLTNVFVTCKGYGELDGEPKETSTMRYFLDDMDSETAIKVEPIHPDLFVLNNEYFLTFFINGEIYDKKLIFKANTISEETLTPISIVDRPGMYLR